MYLRFSLILIFFIQLTISKGQIFNGDVRLHTQEEVDAFAENGYKEITGELFIGALGDLIIPDDDLLEDDIIPDDDIELDNGSNINDISDLISIESVGREVSIYNCPNLTTISGLDSLKESGGLLINFCPNLSSLVPLSNLMFVDGNISIIGGSFTSLNGLNNLKKVTYGIYIQDTQISSLEGLNELDSIDGILNISFNSKLEMLNGLNNLSVVGDNIFIHDNTILTNLNGLNNLTSLGNGFYIEYNPNLINYCALDMESLEITDYDVNNNLYNPSLNDLISGECVDCSSITIDNSTTIIENQITANQTQASYQWLNCDLENPIILGETERTFNASQTGNYKVIINMNGCIDTSDCNYINITGPVFSEICNSNSTRTSFEWIKKVELGGDFIRTTGKETNGYGDYSENILEVEDGETVSVSLTPGYSSRAYKEYWRIWIDWNKDGDFDDIGEKVFEQNGKHKRTGSFVVPLSAESGDYRLRVSMRWKGYSNSCGTFKNGEVEDYTIRINQND